MDASTYTTAPLKEAEISMDFPDGSLSVLNNFAPKWSNKQFNLLRPVATGNWGGGALNGDVQLKSLLQWMAVSATGRPQMIYFTDSNEWMQKVLLKFYVHRFYIPLLV